MKLDDLLKCMYAINVKIIEGWSNRTLFKGHVREIRNSGFKKDFEVISIFNSFEDEDVDILVKEVK